MKGIQSNGFLLIRARVLAEMEKTHGEFSGIDEETLRSLAIGQNSLDLNRVG